MDDEVVPVCSICGDSGVIEQGFWNDDDEFQITSSKVCECHLE